MPFTKHQKLKVMEAINQIGEIMGDITTSTMNLTFDEFMNHADDIPEELLSLNSTKLAYVMIFIYQKINPLTIDFNNPEINIFVQSIINWSKKQNEKPS